MANIAVKRFNWIRSPSVWQRTVAWREKQQAARANFEATNTAASNTFAAASADLAAGMGEIAARVASKRIQSEQLAKRLNALV